MSARRPLAVALAVTAAGAALCGCGAGGDGATAARSTRHRATGAGASGTAGGATGASTVGAWLANQGAPGAYRWLVPVTGAPLSVALDNRARGTTAWRLPGPATLLGGEGRGALEGYVAEQSILPGQRETVYVRAPGSRTVIVRIYRIGWYGGAGGRLELESGPLPVVRQPACAHDARTGLTQCDWHGTLSFSLPRSLVSGVYVVKLLGAHGAQRDCVFVLRALRPAPLLVELPTATWEAYNGWGGDSLYPGGQEVGLTHSTQGVEVSYDRPYATQTGAGQFFAREVAAVRFLERYGYPVSYTTVSSLDSDPAQALRARAVIDVGHSEYWSERAKRALVRAREVGVSLMFMSSDTMAWRVRFAPAGAHSSEAGQAGHVMVAFKELAPLEVGSSEPTGPFPLGGADLVGSSYDGCITQRLPASGPPVYRYGAWRPSPTLAPRWLFAGTGIGPATTIPGIVGYELDTRTEASPTGTHVIGYSSGVSCMGGVVEPSAVHATGAESTMYTARSGALVFASGTLGWEYGLEAVPQASPDVPRRPDGRVVAMTRNLLQHVLSLTRRP
ncbi:MAG: N,N-dimethylformamidase beta subunit family domain-containing protein [Solirubrobacteraceae bacterium]